MLNSFKKMVFCYLVCKLGANAHFIPEASAIYNETIDLRLQNVIIESISKNYIDAIATTKSISKNYIDDIATIKSSPSISWETKIKQ